uniref:SKP1 component POZ domain-containing protein n=1 Tax=Panagrolaimus sp. PS1159 TaxID=55785 RepID=A0AC35GJL2_9BILA
MNILLALLIIFSSYKTFECLPVVAGAVTVSSVNATDVPLLTLKATTLSHIVHLLNRSPAELQEIYQNATDSFEIVTRDGKAKASKSIIERCSPSLVTHLANSTSDSITVNYPVKVIHKVLEFCEYGSLNDENGYEWDRVIDFAVEYDISTLFSYLDKKQVDGFVNAKEKRDRPEAAAKNQKENSSNKNLYIFEVFFLQILFVLVCRYV